MNKTLKPLASILEGIGNTPLLLVEKIGHVSCYAKLEMMNPGGSIKDRVAAQMIADFEERGLDCRHYGIVEGTSGNTGIGLAFICAAKGIPLTIVMPENMSKERQDLMKAYGAQLVLTPASLGMDGAEKEAARLALVHGYLFANQFENESNWKAHYRTTGPEIEAALPHVDAFIAGVGTAGTLMGIGRYLKEKNPALQLIAVEPAESPVLEGQPAGPHGIQGIGANFYPPLFDKTLVNAYLQIKSNEAKAKANDLAKQGLFVGISAAANLLAMESYAKAHAQENLTIVTVFPDGGSKYMSLGIYGK
jgi:cysteine synthase A